VYVSAEGFIHVVGLGQPNLIYTVEATGRISDAGEWFQISSPQANGAGVFEVFYKAGMFRPGRCYRVSLP